MKTESELLTVRELAELLRVSPKTAYLYVQSGAVPATKVGGTWRISTEALERRFEVGAP